MSMRRVSSRPRLVSDADRASKIASLDLENYYYPNDGQHPHHHQEEDSYFLFEQDDVNENDNNTAGGEEERMKSAEASVMVVEEEEEGPSDKMSPLSILLSSSSSDDITLSDYASCCCLYDDDDNRTTTTMKNAITSSLVNLEMSFKQTSLSSNEDEGGMEAAAASAAAGITYMDRQLFATTNLSSSSSSLTACAKRKRLSQQHYLTPNSSFAELHPIPVAAPVNAVASSFRNGVIQTYSRKQPYSNHHHYYYYYPSTTTTTTSSPRRTNTQSPPHSSPLLLLTQLPEETLVLISTHLTHTDIRSLGSTCYMIRMILMKSTCAIENLWMERLRRMFPRVFYNYSTGGGGDDGSSSSSSMSMEEGRRRRRMIHSSNVTFVDDFELPMAASASSSLSSSAAAAAAASSRVGVRVDNTKSDNFVCSSGVNLPLLTGLLAPRYPQVIDLQASSSLGDDGLLLFRSFEMSIPTATSVVASSSSSSADSSSSSANNVQSTSSLFGPTTLSYDRTTGLDYRDNLQLSTTATTNITGYDDGVSPVMGEVVVSVIQFTGRVGTGDRSIRSDKPFPPNCRIITSSSGNNNNNNSHGGGGFKSLSTWMKNHTPLRSRSNKRKNGRTTTTTHSMLRDLSPPPPPLSRQHSRHFPTLSPTTRPFSSSYYARRSLHTPATAPPLSTQRSPLFRFLSSLSHHCDSVSSSNTSSFVDYETTVDDDIGTTFSMENHISHVDDEEDDDIGVNDYGMMIRHNGNSLLEQCKQKFGKMYDDHCNKSIKDNFRPFVIPTVVSSSSSGVVGEDVTVDVTPRLIAYFEVTILDNVQLRDGETLLNSRNNERPLPQQQQPAVVLNNYAPRRRGADPPRPRRRDIPRHNNHQLWAMMPHRVFPPILLPLPFDPEIFAPLDAHARAAAPPNNDNFGQQPQFLNHDHGGNNNIFPQRQNHHQQRHDCVAIGLSALSFNPRSKMPGWDEHSFGYHGDDGGIFHGHGDMLRRYGPSFGPGDTVGCGLEYSTRKIFFVKNGVFLGWAFDKVDKEMVERGLYPTVGVDTECPIHVNFGQVPFKFDWKGFSREKLYV